MLASLQRYAREQGYGENNSKTEKTIVRAGHGRYEAHGSRGTLGFFEESTGPSDLVVKIVNEINDLFMKINHILFKSDAYESLVNFNLLEKQNELHEFIEGDYFRARVNGWAELGVQYLQDENEPKPENCVSILITRDANNLPLRLKLTLMTEYRNPSLEVDLPSLDIERERVIKYNLTYLRDAQSSTEEIIRLSGKLHHSSNQTRISLMNEYNKKWEGQLIVTYLIDQDRARGTVTVTDASGKNVFDANANHINMDGVQPEPQIKTLTQGSDDLQGLVWHRVADLPDTIETPLWIHMIGGLGTAALAYIVASHLTKSDFAATICGEVGAAAGLYFTDRYYRNQAQNEERNNQAQRLTL